MGGLKFELVTTCHAEGYERYGKRMLESVYDNWPGDVHVRVYTEGWEPDKCMLHANRANTTFVPLAVSPWLRDFKKRFMNICRRQGMPWEADRFAHKVAAWTHAALDTEADCLIWMDADTVTHGPIRMEDLEDLAPKGSYWISWLDRRHPPYPECGFFILNCHHPRHRSIVELMVKQYTEDKLLDLEQWHDSWVLWKVVERNRVQANSLSHPGGYGTTHPFINGPLGRWFDHMKGDERKALGRSRARDLVVKREEEYWNG